MRGVWQRAGGRQAAWRAEAALAEQQKGRRFVERTGSSGGKDLAKALLLFKQAFSCGSKQSPPGWGVRAPNQSRAKADFSPSHLSTEKAFCLIPLSGGNQGRPSPAESKSCAGTLRIRWS